MLVTSIFFFSHNAFKSFRKLKHIYFNSIEKQSSCKLCKSLSILPSVHHSQNFLLGLLNSRYCVKKNYIFLKTTSHIRQVRIVKFDVNIRLFVIAGTVLVSIFFILDGFRIRINFRFCFGAFRLVSFRVFT